MIALELAQERQNQPVAAQKQVSGERVSVETLRKMFGVLDDGRLIWLVNRGAVKAGAIAGHASKEGYIEVRVFGCKIYAHRIVYAITHGAWPEKFVDHINGNRSDNRPENLRDVSNAENMQNRIGANANSVSGVRGVHWHKQVGKWCAAISPNGKYRHLGLFSSKEEAAAARAKAEAALFPTSEAARGAA
jgi:hypothetical protein